MFKQVLHSRVIDESNKFIIESVNNDSDEFLQVSILDHGYTHVYHVAYNFLSQLITFDDNKKLLNFVDNLPPYDLFDDDEIF